MKSEEMLIIGGVAVVLLWILFGSKLGLGAGAGPGTTATGDTVGDISAVGF